MRKLIRTFKEVEPKLFNLDLMPIFTKGTFTVDDISETASGKDLNGVDVFEVWYKPNGSDLSDRIFINQQGLVDLKSLLI